MQYGERAVRCYAKHRSIIMRADELGCPVKVAGLPVQMKVMRLASITTAEAMQHAVGAARCEFEHDSVVVQTTQVCRTEQIACVVPDRSMKRTSTATCAGKGVKNALLSALCDLEYRARV